ncbi:hypothetical protein [Streptomyces cellulosae]|uniref:UL36 very large tegument protein n=1 Tax=Streptomyces cellulosae TaxID=1968 RepID=A0ABW7XUU7_STRCE
MTVDQLPKQVREFANYLDGLLARLDQGGGWCGVFWQRDPDGMQACLDGREMPPWDVVEALLQDLATGYGPQAAGAETEHARALHAAALIAYDARPGGRDALGDRFDVMLREQRYAVERQAELGRSLASATTQEEADALRLDLAWARDDHARATRRCAELRSRMTDLDRRTTLEQAQAIRRGATGEGAVFRVREESRAEGAEADGTRTEGWGAGGASHGVPRDDGRGGGGPGPAGHGPGGGRPSGHDTGDARVDGWSEDGAYDGRPDGHGSHRARSYGREAYGAPSDGPGTDGHGAGGTDGAGPRSYGERASYGEQPGGHTSYGERPDARVPQDSAFPDMPRQRDHTAQPAAAADGWREAVEQGPGGTAGGRDARGQTPAGPSAPTGWPQAAEEIAARMSDAHDTRRQTAAGPTGPADPTAPAGPSRPASGAPGGHRAEPSAHDPRLRPTPHPSGPAPAPQQQTPAPQPAPVPKQRRRRRGSARFAGMAEGEAAPAVVPPRAVPPTAVPDPPAAHAPGGRTPRGARFAGSARAEVGPEPQGEPLDGEDRRETVRTVERLMRLRGEGRSGEAHALLAELASWPAARYPLLAVEMQRAGLGADWATLLWEAASLPADRLVAAADALVEAGRGTDGEQILRQGVARPAAEIGQAVLALATEGRRRQVRALLDAYVRVRTPEEAARSAEPDPQTLVPLLVEAAQQVSDERHWDLVHALRVAGFSA